MRAELIATGSELVNGDIINTNSPFLAKELKKIGFLTCFHTVVNDSVVDLQLALKTALQRCELIIITGGLGPTTDDITRIAVAKVLSLELESHQPSIEKIKDIFSLRELPMPESNLQQGLFPRGAIVLPNNIGTAPGAIIKEQDAIIIMLPGPPAEMKQMFLEQVIPFLLENYSKKTLNQLIPQEVIRLTGIGESQIQDRIKEIAIEPEVEIGYLAKYGDIILKLSAKNVNGLEKVQSIRNKIVHRLKDYIYGFGDKTLEYVVGEQLLANNLRIGLTESCTGGLLAHKLTNVPGSSGYLSHAIVTYSNEAKNSLVNVDKSTIEQYTAVSKETTLEMAYGVKSILNVDIGLSITGYAGNAVSGYQFEKERINNDEQIGLVYIGLVTEEETKVEEYRFIGDRITIKEMAAQAGMKMIWQYLSRL